jgi:transcriptional regulator with XRE-family HTH domain
MKVVYMEIISTEKLASVVYNLRNEKNMTQQDLSDKTGINRIMISRIEKNKFIPSIKQLETLSNTLNFDVTTLFVEKKDNNFFVALKSEALNEKEKQGVEKLFSMMLTLRQQIQIRKSFENGKVRN